MPKPPEMVTLPPIHMQQKQLDHLVLLAHSYGLTVEEYLRVLVSQAWRKRQEHERYLRRRQDS